MNCQHVSIHPFIKSHSERRPPPRLHPPAPPRGDSDVPPQTGCEIPPAGPEDDHRGATESRF